jgi:GTP-binding protein
VSRFPNVRFLTSAASPAQFPPDRGAEVAFAGRSNAGKSSAINALAQRNGLARTSKTPGRTRLLNFFELAPAWRLVDLPGYGYASAPESDRRNWVPLLDALRGRSSLCGLMLVVDSRRGIGDMDQELIAWARAAASDLRVHVLLSKADKLTRSEAVKAMRDATAALGGTATVQLFSVLDQTGVKEARDLLVHWLEEGGP